MTKTIKQLLFYIKYNLKTLTIFEIAYRLFGVFLLFPFFSFLFQFSLKMNGLVYLTNRNLISFLTDYKTILIIFFAFILLSLYLFIEFIFLSLIFDASDRRFKITFPKLVYAGFFKVKETLTKHHLFIVTPSLIFFIAIETIFFSLGTNVFEIPKVVIEQINELKYIKIILYGLLVVLFVAFFETIHTMTLFAQDNLSLKEAYKTSRKMLKKNRFKMMTEFAVINLVLNFFIYFMYFLLVIIVGIFVRLLSQQSIILGTVLSVMYALFLILSIVSSLFLIPINYALITVWYHKQKPLDISGQRPIVVQNNEIHFNTKLIKRALIISFIVIFGLNLSNFVSISKKRAYSEYFNSQEVIAHRGASYNAPENTISAFQAALDEGVDAIEFDVRETLDKVPIIMHDSTTSRTTNDINNSSISETTYSYLASLDAGSYFSLEFRGEKIPTLEETLDLLKDQVRVFVELKTSSITLERNTLALLDVKNMLDDAVIMSFNIDQLKRIKMNYPNVKTMLLIPIFYGSIDPILSETFIDYYGLSYQMILNYPQYIDYAHQKEKSVYAWTVNSKASITKVVQSDVDGIITDKPVLAQEITAAKNLPSFFEEILKRFNR